VQSYDILLQSYLTTIAYCLHFINNSDNFNAQGQFPNHILPLKLKRTHRGGKRKQREIKVFTHRRPPNKHSERPPPTLITIPTIDDNCTHNNASTLTTHDTQINHNNTLTSQERQSNNESTQQTHNTRTPVKRSNITTNTKMNKN